MLSIRSFPKIDAHIHFNADRGDLLALAGEYDFSVLTINTEVPEFPPIEQQRQLALKYGPSSVTALWHAATVSTEEVFEKKWADQAISSITKKMSEGACGIKFWKNIGMSIQRPDGSFLMPDDAELVPVFEFLEEQHIPVLGHQGEPKNCWLPVEEMTVKSDRDYFSRHPRYHMYKQPDYPDYRDHIESRDHLLERHPELRFVGLHLASLEWSLDEVARRLDTFPNLAVDLAERFSHLYYHAARDHEQVVRFFREYQDRIIYGTDIIDDPDQDAEAILRELKDRWEMHWKFLATDQQLRSSQIEEPFNGLALPQPVLEKIYRSNALRWYRL
ncbi:amidohydrolase family protein [Halalkalibaculum sp. DA3122]|uniref:amidohydrolase family protein n=1 Tax=Halalkalibaculum sp. DA3122 TaxID=3373607 RepID=UPI0037540A40